VTETATAVTGLLRVSVDDKSRWLSQHLPFVVRDSGLSVVGRGRAGDPSMALPVGLYSVEAITPRGRMMNELVRIDPAAPAEVVVTEDSGSEGGGYADAAGPGLRGASEIELTGTTACRLVVEDPSGWTFEPDQVLARVPTAAFRVDGRDWLVSLPLMGSLPTCSILRTSRN